MTSDKNKQIKRISNKNPRESPSKNSYGIGGAKSERGTFFIKIK